MVIIVSIGPDGAQVRIDDESVCGFVRPRQPSAKEEPGEPKVSDRLADASPSKPKEVVVPEDVPRGLFGC